MGNQMMGHVPVLTIDGLSGTGKTTVAAQIAQELGWHVLFSGTLYRYLAYVRSGRIIADDDYLLGGDILSDLSRLSCRVSQYGDLIVLLGNENLTKLLHTEEIAKQASELAGCQKIRKQLLSIQRMLAKSPGLVAEGRDMGRVVFPGATLKVYLTADEEVRVQRRFNQLNRTGNDVKIAQIADLQMQRDARDLKQAYKFQPKHAREIVIDTSGLSINDVKAKIYESLQQVEAPLNH
jgi:cytidylate kinase